MTSRARQALLRAALWGTLGAIVFTGCAPAIGDSCSTNLDCSVTGERVCDLARPNGACTVLGCEADNCPDDAVCVRWRPDPSRLSFTACMKRCNQDSQCREGDGYRCMSAEMITTTPEMGVSIAEVVDLEREDELGVHAQSILLLEVLAVLAHVQAEVVETFAFNYKIDKVVRFVLGE